MWTQITIDEAVRILLSGGKVNDGFYNWHSSIKLRYPWRWRKARKRKELARKLRGSWAIGDGLWVCK